MAEKTWKLVEPTYTGYTERVKYGVYEDIIRQFICTGRNVLEVDMPGKPLTIYIGLRRVAEQIDFKDKVRVSKRQDKINLVRIG